MLGVTFNLKFSVSQHIDNLLAACSQSLFALRTLRQHGLPDDALHEVFQAVVINNLTHASPAWWGFASADNRNRLEAFLRKCTKLGYRAKHSTTFASICDDADCKLFTRITGNTQHLLYPLLLPWTPASLHSVSSSMQSQLSLPDRTSALRDRNFIMRILYCDALYWQFYFLALIHCVTAFCLLFY